MVSPLSVVRNLSSVNYWASLITITAAGDGCEDSARAQFVKNSATGVGGGGRVEGGEVKDNAFLVFSTFRLN